MDPERRGDVWPAPADVAVDPASGLAAAVAHPDVQRLARALRDAPGREADVAGVEPPPRRAAVALVLRVGSGGALELLFIKRAEFAGDPWSGHVAFPGGRHEPGDHTLWHTARRETHEELALDLARDGLPLGTLDDLFPRHAALPSIVVRPYVAVAAPGAPLALSHEVAAAFWVPVRRLIEPEAGVTSTVRAHGLELEVPSFVHDGHVIWGLTERILRQLLAHLG
jgi:8-oxo-dGTP pyrophosphatase MutT (NUDIX family)